MTSAPFTLSVSEPTESAIEESAPVSTGTGEPRKIPLVFKGRAGEYFRIWIINLALSLATLGIYSAWAKVRRVRYIYGNTYFNDSSFEYLADPRRVLKGRVIAAILIVIWFVIFNWGPLIVARWGTVLTIASYALFVVIAPIFLYKALRFRLFCTAHRGMRFGFSGDLKESFVANGLWLVLGIVSGGLLYPVYVRRRIAFLANNARIGVYRFHFDGGNRVLYKVYALCAGLGLVLFVLAIVAIFAITMFAINSDSSGFFDFLKESDEVSMNSIIKGIVSSYLVMILIASFFMGFLKARLTNYTLNNLSIENTRFLSELRGIKLGWIYFSNLLALLISFGLLGPWAKMRATRYRIENVSVLLGDDLDLMIAFDGLEQSAFGEEAAGLFDMDFGL